MLALYPRDVFRWGLTCCRERTSTGHRYVHFDLAPQHHTYRLSSISQEFNPHALRGPIQKPCRESVGTNDRTRHALRTSRTQLESECKRCGKIPGGDEGPTVLNRAELSRRVVRAGLQLPCSRSSERETQSHEGHVTSLRARPKKNHASAAGGHSTIEDMDDTRALSQPQDEPVPAGYRQGRQFESADLYRTAISFTRAD